VLQTRSWKPHFHYWNWLELLLFFYLIFDVLNGLLLYLAFLTLQCSWSVDEYICVTLEWLAVFSARRNIYISRLCYDVSVRLSVRLSVTEVHWRIIANLGFKFWSQFTAHCGRGACGCERRVEGSSRAMLATARPSCILRGRDIVRHCGDQLAGSFHY